MVVQHMEEFTTKAKALRDQKKMTPHHEKSWTDNPEHAALLALFSKTDVRKADRQREKESRKRKPEEPEDLSLRRERVAKTARRISAQKKSAKVLKIQKEEEEEEAKAATGALGIKSDEVEEDAKPSAISNLAVQDFNERYNVSDKTRVPFTQAEEKAIKGSCLEQWDLDLSSGCYFPPKKYIWSLVKAHKDVKSSRTSNVLGNKIRALLKKDDLMPRMVIRRTHSRSTVRRFEGLYHLARSGKGSELKQHPGLHWFLPLGLQAVPGTKHPRYM